MAGPHSSDPGGQQPGLILAQEEADQNLTPSSMEGPSTEPGFGDDHSDASPMFIDLDVSSSSLSSTPERRRLPEMCWL